MKETGPVGERTRSLRMPLDLGTAALLPYVFGVGLVAFGVVLAGYSYRRSGAAPAIGVVALIVGAIVLLVAVRRRASDILFTEGGLEVRGGPRSGLRATWAALGERPCELVQGRTSELRLRVDGRTVQLAVARDEDEREAHAALAQTITAMAAPGARPAGVSGDVLRCPACGAAGRAEDVESIPCTYCGVSVPVAPALRARIRDAHDAVASRAGKERSISKLTNQPSSRTINGALLASAPLVATALVLVFVGAHSRIVDGRVIDMHAVMIASCLALASLGLYLVLRHLFASRRALRVVTLNFGPRPPEEHGGRPTCRRCNAPLDGGDDATFLDCAYCGAEHVAGFGLLRARGRELEDETTLASALDLHGARLRLSRVLGGAGLAMIAAAILLGPVSIGYVTVHTLDWRCKSRQGDGEACWQAGDLVGSSNAEAAAMFYWHGCKRFNLIACKRLGASYITFWDSPDGAFDAYKRVCDRGDDEGCCSLACLHVRGQGLEVDLVEAKRLFKSSCGNAIEPWCNAHVPLPVVKEPAHR